MHRNLAADLLLMTPDNELQLVKLCAFYPGCTEEINELHEKVREGYYILQFGMQCYDVTNFRFGHIEIQAEKQTYPFITLL